MSSRCGSSSATDFVEDGDRDDGGEWDISVNFVLRRSVRARGALCRGIQGNRLCQIDVQSRGEVEYEKGGLGKLTRGRCPAMNSARPA